MVRYLHFLAKKRPNIFSNADFDAANFQRSIAWPCRAFFPVIISREDLKSRKQCDCQSARHALQADFRSSLDSLLAKDLTLQDTTWCTCMDFGFSLHRAYFQAQNE
jgi:hypothetical protein